MGGNRFATHDGAHVTGAVAMALNDQGEAVPVGADTPIGLVRIEVEPLVRALAAHAALITGKPVADTYAAITAFIQNRNPAAPPPARRGTT